MWVIRAPLVRFRDQAPKKGRQPLTIKTGVFSTIAKLQGAKTHSNEASGLPKRAKGRDQMGNRQAADNGQEGIAVIVPHSSTADTVSKW